MAAAISFSFFTVTPELETMEAPDDAFRNSFASDGAPYHSSSTGKIQFLWWIQPDGMKTLCNAHRSSGSSETESNNYSSAKTLQKKNEAILAIYGEDDFHGEPLLQKRVRSHTLIYRVNLYTF